VFGVFMVVLLGWPLDAHSKAAKETAAPRPAEKPDLIQPGDRLHIHATPALPENPIRGVFRVERSGKVALGPDYGRVEVKGLTLEEAEVAIQKHLARIIKGPAVSVTRYDPLPSASELALEERVRRLERELHALRNEVEELRKKPRQ
jgi:hypothetical protein